MRILVLCGGKGTRLYPLTEHIPKPLVSIHGNPFLYYLFKRLKKHDLVLSVGYKKEAIKNYCKEEDYLVEYVEEEEALNTGGALYTAQNFFENSWRFTVINGDTVLFDDFNKIARQHKGTASAVVAREMGTNKRKLAGIYFFSNKIFKYIDNTKEKLEKKLVKLPFKVNIIKTDSYYIDIGTFPKLNYAKRHLFKGE